MPDDSSNPFEAASVGHPDKVYSISEITEIVKRLLEQSFESVWVEGEISNYTHHSSGHRYFTLKDDKASLKCVIWRQTGRSLDFDPAAGLHVRALGRFSVYPPHGAYQLVVTRLVKVGIGALEIAFQKLKEKLQREGLFEPERKRPIPPFPRVVGIVTSPTGAAIADMLKTITARFPGLHVVLCPARVQGDGAAAEIVAAIGTLNGRTDIDVIIVGRGGGSLEDLWAFNEEPVARAIAASRLPVISAVGHEVDFTIADFVADHRAATPTAAAQLVTEHWVAARDVLPEMIRRMRRAARHTVEFRRREIARLKSSHALQRPGDLLAQWSQRLDLATETATRQMRQRLRRHLELMQGLNGRLTALSPEAVLRRGYSITRRVGRADALRDAAVVSDGDELETRLSRGIIRSTVSGSGP
ncbi:MAG TPA: exodeoxyribonuclease VII large subunit [candidate division Zixibacteria bacterium]|jgi:exodeoxyribonuclease VII large subunit